MALDAPSLARPGLNHGSIRQYGKPMAATRRARGNAGAAPSTDVAALEKELAEARKKLEGADARKERAIARATSALRKENEMLEAQLTRLVREIGQLRFVVDRVQVLETELRGRDLRIAEAEAEVERLRAALSSGRPTAARAAAAAAQAARLFGTTRPS